MEQKAFRRHHRPPHLRQEHYRMVFGRGYAPEVRNDPLGGLHFCIYLRHFQEEGHARGLLLEAARQCGKGNRRTRAAGVLHHSRSNGEIRADTRPVVPLCQAAQGTKGAGGSLRQNRQKGARCPACAALFIGRVRVVLRLCVVIRQITVRSPAGAVSLPLKIVPFLASAESAQFRDKARRENVK